MSEDRILVVTDQLPYPPRNSVTLPLFHLVEQLRRSHAVQICLIQGAGSEDQRPWLADNERRFGPVIRVVLPRRGLLARIWGELSGRDMVEHGWRAWSHGIPKGLDEAADDAQVLVTPLSAVARWRVVCDSLPDMRPNTQVALVNDCRAAAYRWQLNSREPGLMALLKAVLDRLRSPLIARIEAHLLRPYRRVLLQTEADRTAMRRLVGEGTGRRSRLAPNGVRAELFDVRPQRSQRVLLVAELGGEPGRMAEWLAREVWPQVRDRCPRAELSVIGRSASASLRKLVAEYTDCGVIWSPVFGGFGLINKTLEGMACGLPVVGGLAAFNGLAGFKNWVHGVGLEAPDAKAMAEATARLLESPEQGARMGDAARALVHGSFGWERAADVVRRAFDRRDPTISRTVPRGGMVMPQQPF
jgi:glycosyltransferase involved in cell wall biosynthesis